MVAANLVAPAKKAGAIAMMFAGLTTANVLGVPFGTLLGQQLGLALDVLGDHRSSASSRWSASRRSCPRSRLTGQGPGLRGELGLPRPARSGSRSLVTVLGFGGMFGAFTYIAYTLTEVTGFAASTVPWLLILFGVGLFVGNYVGGRAADRSVPRTLFVVLGALALVLAVFALTATSQAVTVVALVLMGGFGFATVPGLQMRIMDYAGQAPDPGLRRQHRRLQRRQRRGRLARRARPSPPASATPPRCGWEPRSPWVAWSCWPWPRRWPVRDATPRPVPRLLPQPAPRLLP